jgi:hypothetical protein
VALAQACDDEAPLVSALEDAYSSEHSVFIPQDLITYAPFLRGQRAG